MPSQGEEFPTIASRLIAAGVAAALFLGAALAGAAAQAAGSTSAAQRPYMREGGEVRGPSGYYELCARAPWECPSPPPSATGFDTRVVLNARARSTLSKLNATLNQAYQAVTDQDLYGLSDYWTLPTDSADCEDYVLAKRKALADAGWPEAALLIGVVRGGSTPYHAVLIVRTDRGELVLDNLRDDVRDWRDTGYEWIVRQSLADPNRWVRVLEGAPAPAVASDRGRAEMRPASLD